MPSLPHRPAILANVALEVPYAGAILSNLAAAGMVVQVPIQLSPCFSQVAMVATQIGTVFPAMLACGPMPVVSRQCRGCFQRQTPANYERKK
jgi:hypothetical protein